MNERLLKLEESKGWALWTLIRRSVADQRGSGVGHPLMSPLGVLGADDHAAGSARRRGGRRLEPETEAADNMKSLAIMLGCERSIESSGLVDVAGLLILPNEDSPATEKAGA